MLDSFTVLLANVLVELHLFILQARFRPLLQITGCRFRPLVSKIEGDLYYFDWPELQLEEYFKRFGRDAIVIKPTSLKEKIKKFYYYGLREYSK